MNIKLACDCHCPNAQAQAILIGAVLGSTPTLLIVYFHPKNASVSFRDVWRQRRPFEAHPPENEYDNQDNVMGNFFFFGMSFGVN